ncbi:MAG TPA: M20/M25/M40 family metallo-hydrolase [Candidatus Sulfotelmatobacter sp.]
MCNQQLFQCLMIVSTFLFPFGSQGQLQKISSTDVSQSFKTVEDEALKHPIAYQLLKVLTDEIGPRLTGSPPDSRAQQWALKEMRSIGLSNVRGEEWQLERGWRRGYARAQLVIPFHLDLAVASYGWSGSTPNGGAEADLVLVDSAALELEAQEHSANWPGKILLLTPKDPKHFDLFKSMADLPAFLTAAASAHAIAIINGDPRPGILLPHTGPIGLPFHRTDLVVLDMASEQRDLIARTLQLGKVGRVKIDVQNEFTRGAVPSRNIVGEIPGSDYPEQVVVLGAHLDSWDLGTGAVDDGFGVAAVLGSAKAILSAGVKPKRTIRFILFTGEEQGLLGSHAYLKQHQAEARNFVCAVVLDWGSGPITRFPLAGHDEFAAPMQELFRSSKALASMTTSPGYLTFTDAYSFTLAGIPGIAPLQDSPNYTMVGHSAADTLDKVNESTLNQDTAMMASMAIWIADYPIRIGSVWSPEQTSQSLQEQRRSLQLLGLWPF